MIPWITRAAAARRMQPCALKTARATPRRSCIRRAANWDERGAMLFSNKDALRVGDILARAAQAEIMPRFRTLNADQVRQKSSSFDLVTEGDEAAERAISKELAAAFPGSVIIGEEAASKNP